MQGSKAIFLKYIPMALILPQEEVGMISVCNQNSYKVIFIKSHGADSKAL